ncbi:MAG: hypothetical protein ABSF81_13425 [Bacteroidales bacterium]
MKSLKFIPSKNGPWTKYLTGLKFLRIDVEKIMNSINDWDTDRVFLVNSIMEIKNLSGSKQTPFSDFKKINKCKISYSENFNWLVPELTEEIRAKFVNPLLVYGINVEKLRIEYIEITKERDILFSYMIHLKNKPISLRVVSKTNN